MAVIFSGGKNGGNKAVVNDDGQLETASVVQTMCYNINKEKGLSFSVLIDKTPTGAGDCFLYIKNNDTKDLCISSLNLHAASDEIIEVKLSDEGTPVGGTAIVPANRNAGSGEAADGTFETGVDITSLSGGDTVDYIALDGASGFNKYYWRSKLLIPKGKTFTLYATTGAIALKGSITLCFRE